ncbi:hypothetical protein DKG34_26060 [Streptomyces sp. NWU49]|nr:hypothetical protein DKG34_26060 [Streptomyces sp. NWU49]
MFLGPVSTRSGVLQEVPGHAMRAHITAADGRAGGGVVRWEAHGQPLGDDPHGPTRHGLAGLPAAGALRSPQVRTHGVGAVTQAFLM